jgi:hypothetical protein
MKWFDRWFQRQAKKAWDNNYDDQPRLVKTASAPGRISQELDSRGAATIRIHAAHGGKVIEISHWDERKSEHERDLYIVNDDTELGPELTSIIMQHSLRY